MTWIARGGNQVPGERPLLSAGAQGAASEPSIDLRDLGRSVIRSRWLMGGIVGASLVVGILMTALQQREYEGETTVLVNPRKAGPSLSAELGQLSGIAGLAGIGEGGIGTETALLESRAIAEAVVDSLGLRVRLLEPDRSRASVFRVIQAPREAASGKFELNLRSANSYEVRIASEFAGQVPESVEIGTPFRLGDVTLVLDPELANTPERRLVIEIQPFNAAVRQVRTNLLVSQYSRGAQVLSLTYTDRDSVLAAAVPNFAARNFIRYRTNLTQADARTAVDFLREQVSSYQARLKAAEDDLRRYREDAQIVNPVEEASHQVQQLADLQARRSLLVAERDAIGEAIARVERNADSVGAVSAYRELASFPLFLSNGAVQSVLRTLTELENERSALLVRRTPENDDVRRLTARIAELERQLYYTAQSYRNGLQNQIASLEASAERFGSELETVPRQQLTYQRLLREQQLLEEIYTLLQTRLKEAEIREVEDLSDVRILDAAIVPEKPVSPRPALNMVLAVFLGLVIALGTAAVRALVDPRVRTRYDAVVASAGLPVVGLIPHVAGITNNGNVLVPAQRLRRLLPARTGSDERVNPLIVREAPGSPASEAYRALRTNLTLGYAGDQPRLITICSAAEDDGKSTSAANLALAMAQQGYRVLLADCDLRKPQLHVMFATSREPGLADVLLGRTTINDAVREIGVSGTTVPMHLLTAGTHVPTPAELIGSPGMRDLLQLVRSQYDYVILDAPPLSAASEAAVLGVLTDTSVLVARATVTHKRDLAEAVSQLKQLRIPLAGIVINDADEGELTYRPYVD